MTNETTLAPMLPTQEATPVATRIFGQPVDDHAGQHTATTLLNLAATHQDMYVFHGFHLPNSGWTLDHLVLYRGVIFLIDDKQWEANCSYTLTEHLSGNAGASSYTSIVLRDEQPFSDNILKPRWHETQLQQWLPGYTFRSTVNVHGRGVDVTGNFKRYSFLFIAADDLDKQLRFMLDSIEDGGPSAQDQAFVVAQLSQLVNLGVDVPQPKISFPIQAPGSDGFKQQQAIVDPTLVAVSTPSKVTPIIPPSSATPGISQHSMQKPRPQITEVAPKRRGLFARLGSAVNALRGDANPDHGNADLR